MYIVALFSGLYVTSAVCFFQQDEAPEYTLISTSPWIIKCFSYSLMNWMQESPNLENSKTSQLWRRAWKDETAEWKDFRDRKGNKNKFTSFPPQIILLREP